MKRDMDLIRQVLKQLEENEDSDGQGAISLEADGRSDREVSYHVMLLSEAGLIVAEMSGTQGPQAWQWFPHRLTWSGHEFLDAARDERLWKKAKKIVQEKAGGLSFEVLKALLFRLATDAVMGP